MSIIVAIVGRPNVGKSTLFNRLIGRRYAITAEESGTTRDRIFHTCSIEKTEFTLVDTGGIEDAIGQTIEDNIQLQSELAVKDADLVILAIDGTQALTPDDFKAGELLRKAGKEVILVATKCDSGEAIDPSNIFEAYKLGFGEAIKISAIHKFGTDLLKKTILGHLKTIKKSKPKTGRTGRPKKEDITNIAFVGKPNVGKSSLLNALFGEDKVIVSDVPGTTRDSTDTIIEYQGKKFNFIDTAGLRRRGKIERGIEKFSSLRSLESIDRADVACLLIDGEKRISNQDCHVAQYVLEKHKGLILVVNKIDLLEKGEEERNKIIFHLQRRFAFVPWAPVLFVSAKTKKHTTKVFEFAEQIKEERAKRIPTRELNLFIEQIVARHHQSNMGITNPKIFYATQLGENPPWFNFVVNKTENFHFSYMRYIENRLREKYGYGGTGIKITVKARSNRNEKKPKD